MVSRQPAGAVRSRRHQRPVCINLPAQQHYFCVAPGKSFSVFCNHSCPLDNVAVEGFKSICEIAAGSVVGLGLRAISGGSAVCVEAQPLNASKVSASNGIAHRLRSGEGIGVLLCGGGVGGFLACRFGLVGARGFGALERGLRGGGDQLLVRELFEVQTPGLNQQKPASRNCCGHPAIGFELGKDHRHALHQNHHMAIRIGLISRPSLPA